MSTTNITPAQLLKLVAGHESVINLEYEPEWANGTGYFDGLARKKLEPGKTYASTDPAGRAILACATRRGNIVAFQRYCDNDYTVCWCGDTDLLGAVGAKADPERRTLEEIVGYDVMMNDGKPKIYRLAGRARRLSNLLDDMFEDSQESEEQ